MVGLGEMLAVAAVASVQAAVPGAQPPASTPSEGPRVSPAPTARSAPPSTADGATGPVTASPESAPPSTSAQTVEAPAPKVGGPLRPVAVNPGPAGSGVVSYAPAFFTEFRPSTALDMVNHLPGFSEDDGEQVRGYSGAAGNVLIDGRRPASKGDSVSSLLSRINAIDVDHIELIRGGADGVDMQGRTVLANVVRKGGDSTQVVAQASVHVFLEDGHHVPGGSVMITKRFDGRTLDLTLTRGSGLDDSVGGGRYVIRDGAGRVLSDVAAHTTGDGGGVALSAAFKTPLAGGDLRLNGRVSENYFKSTVDEGYRLASDDHVLDRSRTRQAEFGGNYERKLGPVDAEAVLLQRLGRTFSGEQETAPAVDGRFSGVNDTGETIVRLSGRYAPIQPLTLQVGAEGAYNFLEGHTRFSFNGADVPLPSAEVKVEETRGEFFGQATYKPIAALTLEAGVRFEISDISETGDSRQDRSFFYAKPRFAAAYSLDADTQLRLRAEKKVGQLDFGNFVSSTNFAQNQINAGNPDLRPDQRWQYEAALERKFWNKGSVTVTLTHETLDDVVDLVPIIGPGFAFDAPGNIGSGTADTLDIEATVPLDPLGLKGGTLTSSTLWRTSEVTDPLTKEKRRISSQRPNNIQLVYEQDLPALNAKAGVLYYRAWTEVSYRLTEVDHRVLTPPYVQLYAEYKPRPDVKVRVELTNIIPFRFQYQQDIYAGPRNSSPLAQRILLDLQSQPRMYFQVRKSFQ